MRRLLLVGALVATVVIVGAAIGLIWTAARPVGSTGGKPTSAVEATAKVEPAVHAFGEPVVATIAVVVDNEMVDPASVTVDSEFGFYEPAGPLTIERRDAGAISTVTYRYPLRCLGEGCDPVGARQTVDFPTGRVGYLFNDTVKRAFTELDWPGHQVTGRVTPADLDRIDWHASVTRIPEPSYRVEPLRLATGILLLAIAIAVAGGWLAWRLLRPEKVADEETSVVRKLSPLEQALAAAGLATESGNATERKRALERVAFELTGAGEVTLAADARALAWSQNGSRSIDLDELRSRVAEIATRTRTA